MKNKHICRGIIKFEDSKIKRFCYGYYVKIQGKHYILPDDCEFENLEYKPNDEQGIVGFVEITKEPDKFFREIKGKKIWENDIERYEQFVEGKSIGFMTATIFWCEEELAWLVKDELGHCYGVRDYDFDIEIIGNTHNVKECEDDK
jgi:hypothetical protein